MSHPAKAAGWDYVDVVPTGAHHLALVLGDVSGQVGAAALAHGGSEHLSDDASVLIVRLSPPEPLYTPHG